jgi:hypothetical protein
MRPYDTHTCLHIERIEQSCTLAEFYVIAPLSLLTRNEPY